VASVADRLADLFRTTVGVDSPVRIRAWDGSEAGCSDGPVLVLRSHRALRRLFWRPGELGLARAYVSGDIDVNGDLTEGLRRVRQLARSQPGVSISSRHRARAALRSVRLGALGLPPRVPVSEARLTGRLHTRRRDSDAYVGVLYRALKPGGRLLLQQMSRRSDARALSACRVHGLCVAGRAAR
jgi:cyclopropane-fatty-acyl-phospholipid synthase